MPDRSSIVRHLRRDWPVLLILILPFVVLPFVWGRLPDRVPVHWNFHGQPDRYGSKYEGLLVIPCLNVLVYLFFKFFSRIDPKRATTSEQKPLPAYRFAIIATLAVLYFIILFALLGVSFDFVKAILLVTVVLMLVVGNYLGAVRPNYFVGVRLPWTLEDPENWRRTHRATGRVWVLTSLVLLALWLFVDTATFTVLYLAGVVVMVAYPIVFSYRLYARGRERPSS